ncbi:unnamed protein product [Amoebophrya sp. A25]|nr:unnamed protein product [Amoebophrya sp. A25]|eukprot:GSA25T00012514001.1
MIMSRCYRQGARVVALLSSNGLLWHQQSEVDVGLVFASATAVATLSNTTKTTFVNQCEASAVSQGHVCELVGADKVKLDDCAKASSISIGTAPGTVTTILTRYPDTDDPAGECYRAEPYLRGAGTGGTTAGSYLEVTYTCLASGGTGSAKYLNVPTTKFNSANGDLLYLALMRESVGDAFSFGGIGAATTLAPTTLAPTTLAPTTLAPTTLAPTTLAPTTLPPTTLPPTTAAPPLFSFVTTLPPATAAPALGGLSFVGGGGPSGPPLSFVVTTTIAPPPGGLGLVGGGTSVGGARVLREGGEGKNETYLNHLVSTESDESTSSAGEKRELSIFGGSSGTGNFADAYARFIVCKTTTSTPGPATTMTPITTVVVTTTLAATTTVVPASTVAGPVRGSSVGTPVTTSTTGPATTVGATITQATSTTTSTSSTTAAYSPDVAYPVRIEGNYTSLEVLPAGVTGPILQASSLFRQKKAEGLRDGLSLPGQNLVVEILSIMESTSRLRSLSEMSEEEEEGHDDDDRHYSKNRSPASPPPRSTSNMLNRRLQSSFTTEWTILFRVDATMKEPERCAVPALAKTKGTDIAVATNAVFSETDWSSDPLFAGNAKPQVSTVLSVGVLSLKLAMNGVAGVSAGTTAFETPPLCPGVTLAPVSGLLGSTTDDDDTATSTEEDNGMVVVLILVGAAIVVGIALTVHFCHKREQTTTHQRVSKRVSVGLDSLENMKRQQDGINEDIDIVEEHTNAAVYKKVRKSMAAADVEDIDVELVIEKAAQQKMDALLITTPKVVRQFKMLPHRKQKQQKEDERMHQSGLRVSTGQSVREDGSTARVSTIGGQLPAARSTFASGRNSLTPRASGRGRISGGMTPRTRTSSSALTPRMSAVEKRFSRENALLGKRISRDPAAIDLKDFINRSSQSSGLSNTSIRNKMIVEERCSRLSRLSAPGAQENAEKVLIGQEAVDADGNKRRSGRLSPRRVSRGLTSRSRSRKSPAAKPRWSRLPQTEDDFSGVPLAEDVQREEERLSALEQETTEADGGRTSQETDAGAQETAGEKHKKKTKGKGKRKKKHAEEQYKDDGNTTNQKPRRADKVLPEKFEAPGIIKKDGEDGEMARSCLMGKAGTTGAGGRRILVPDANIQQHAWGKHPHDQEQERDNVNIDPHPATSTVVETLIDIDNHVVHQDRGDEGNDPMPEPDESDGEGQNVNITIGRGTGTAPSGDTARGGQGAPRPELSPRGAKAEGEQIPHKKKAKAKVKKVAKKGSKAAKDEE